MTFAKRIIVTGGAGFLGSRLCQCLVDEGHSVIAVDSLLTGTIDNLRSLLHHQRFEFMKEDVRKKLCIDGAVDEIYNLACPASPAHYQVDPISTIQTNVLGSMNLLDLALEKNSRILQASTSEVYGDPECHPQPETYLGNVNPTGIRACYDEGKRCAETLFFDYHRTYGTRIRVARIFNTYGPGMSATDGRVISNFIVQALRNEDITVYGDGTHTRSFCYRDDLIDGLICLMNATPAETTPVNLGNPEEYTISEIAELILRLTGSNSKIVFRPLPQDDPARRRPDISLAKTLLNWSPQTSLIAGLSNTISYFKCESKHDGACL